MIDKVKTPEKKLDSEPIKAPDAASGMPEDKDSQAPAGVAVGATLPASRITQEDWDKAHKPQAWNETAGGRLAIRTFSRGIMGAMFFTAGGIWNRKMFPNAETLAKTANHPYKQYNAVETKLFDTVKEGNPLQFFAKLFDIVAGVPIKSTVHLFSGDHGTAMRSVHFKPNKYQSRYPMSAFPDPTKANIGKGETTGKVYGRSLGEEVVFTTFDFFCASIGDAMGRDIAGWFDPAVKKEWTDDKGHIKWPETVKSMCKSAWQYVSYNGGEDWAVALPYVYFVRGHRKLMDHISPGYQYESDIALNASSLKVNTKIAPHQVAGSYALESMIDYQNRFTAYNIGTLMYRELYDKAAHAINDKHVNLYGAPDAPVDPNRSFLDKTGDVLKWMARSTIKGLICMTPVVPFFSITRATQNRQNALFIDPTENAALGFIGKDGKPHYILAGMGNKPEHGYTSSTPVSYAKNIKDGNSGYGKLTPLTDASGRIITYSPQTGNPIVHGSSGAAKFDYYAKRHNMVENFFSSLGRWGENAAKSLNPLADKIDASSKRSGNTLGKRMKLAAGLMPTDDFNRVPRGFINASMSYTPYMYMKAETARLWDTGKMDLAAEGLIDGVTAFDGKRIKRGFGEIWDAILHKPFADEVRDAEGERRRMIDTSQAADQTNADAERTHQQQLKEQQRYKVSKDKLAEASAPFDGYVKQQEEKRQAKKTPVAESGLSWRERAIQGKQDDDVAVATQHSPKSHTEREAMREFLASAVPPTNSIH